MMHIQGSLTIYDIYVYITCIYIGRWPLTARVTTTKILTEGSQPKPSFAIATRLPHLVYTYVKWKTFWLYMYIFIYTVHIHLNIYIYTYDLCVFSSVMHDATCRNPPKTHSTTNRAGPAPEDSVRLTKWNSPPSLWEWDLELDMKKTWIRPVKGWTVFLWILYLKGGCW